MPEPVFLYYLHPHRRQIIATASAHTHRCSSYRPRRRLLLLLSVGRCSAGSSQQQSAQRSDRYLNVHGAARGSEQRQKTERRVPMETTCMCGGQQKKPPTNRMLVDQVVPNIKEVWPEGAKGTIFLASRTTPRPTASARSRSLWRHASQTVSPSSSSTSRPNSPDRSVLDLGFSIAMTSCTVKSGAHCPEGLRMNSSPRTTGPSTLRRPPTSTEAWITRRGPPSWSRSRWRRVTTL